MQRMRGDKRMLSIISERSKESATTFDGKQSEWGKGTTDMNELLPKDLEPAELGRKDLGKSQDNNRKSKSLYES